MKSMKLRSVTAALAGMLLVGWGANAMADTTDDLLQALIAKGVLTEEEAAPLLKGREAEINKKAQDKNSEIKASFKDGIGFESGDHQNAISVNGRIQADYHTYGQANAQNTDTFDVRRAYLTVKGKFYSDYEFNVTADFGQGQTTACPVGTACTATNQLDVAYFGINWWESARLRFGQIDMPFGMEHLTSDLFTDFTERGLTEALVPGKERGAEVFGTPAKGVWYGLALSTGRGKNVNNADNQVDGLDVIGRATVNLADIFNQQGVVYHVGADFSHGNVSADQATNSGVLATNSFLVGQGNAKSQTEGRGITFFSPGSLNMAPGADVERTRMGLEAAIGYGPFKVQSEWMRHDYNGVSLSTPTGSTSHNFDKNVSAWYVSANWILTGESYVDTYKEGVWGRIHPKNEFVHPSAGEGIGAWVVGIRFDQYNADDFAFGTGAGAVSKISTTPGAIGNGISTPDGAHAWTAGVTWILNPNLRFQANYIDTKFENGYVAFKDDQGNVKGITNGEKAVTLRGTFDF